MAQQIQLRNDTTAGWEYANPVLAQAEVGVDTTLGKFKIGDGTSRWNALQFQSASIADFIFEYDSEEGDSVMTVTDHDMVIRTVRDEDSVGSDCDVNIEAADDVFIRAFGDEVGIYASDQVEIRTNNYDGQGTGNGGEDSHSWTFDRNGHIQFPDGTVQTTSAQGITPLPSFLTWREGRTHLPELNTHFGWNSTGLWFQNASEGDGVSSYPVFTDFTIPQNTSVVVEFDVNINDECSDVGVCVYVDGTTPQWAWDPNTTRIAAQFDCTNLELYGRTTEVMGQVGIPEPGLYRVRFQYNPTASTDKVTISYVAVSSPNDVIETLTINEALPTGPYRIGFAADQNSSNAKTYISYASINVTDDNTYSGDLDTGNSGTSNLDLVVPTAIKDGDGDDFITFTRTNLGTARIETPQDDLSLRSARDITLFAGSEGPGNVYIGWGDATITPNATNRVATIADVTAATGLGDITFEGNSIIGNGSMSLVPDSNVEDNDQFIVIAPTDSDHIHIRAGGSSDESDATLILGGEKTKVSVSDNAGAVQIATSWNNNTITLTNEGVETSSTFTTDDNVYLFNIIDTGWSVTNSTNVTAQITGSNSPGGSTVTFSVAEADFFVPNENYTFRPTTGTAGDIQWNFRADGIIEGPSMGSLKVLGITNGQPGYGLYLYSNQGEISIEADQNVVIASDSADIILNADGSVYIGSDNAGNEVARMSDRAYVRTNVPTTSLGLEGEVAGLVADDANYHYYCTGTYDGTTHIWKRRAWSEDQWGV